MEESLKEFMAQPQEEVQRPTTPSCSSCDPERLEVHEDAQPGAFRQAKGTPERGKKKNEKTPKEDQFIMIDDVDEENIIDDFLNMSEVSNVANSVEQEIIFNVERIEKDLEMGFHAG